MVSSYRAVLLRDGRIAIQVHAADQGAGVLDNGVSTSYSHDGGATWHSQVHRAILDDFGRPALFETIIGPVPAGVDVLLGIRSHDAVGNVSVQIPVDAVAIRAPQNAERLINVEALDLASVDGNPLFATEAAARLAARLGAADASDANGSATGSLASQGAIGQFELRRAREQRTVPAFFRRSDVTLSGFTRMPTRLRREPREDGREWTLLRLPGWR